MPNATDIPSCQFCGRRMEGDEANPARHRTVKRVVRPGHRYGALTGRTAGPGETVFVEAREIAHPSVISATMSMKEHLALVGKQKAAAEPPPPGRLAKLVADNFAATAADTRRQIELHAWKAQEAERVAEMGKLSPLRPGGEAPLT